MHKKFPPQQEDDLMSPAKLEPLIDRFVNIYGRSSLAALAGKDTGTVRRWEIRETSPSADGSLANQLELLLPRIKQPGYGAFKFIDLFAGIGGLRLAFDKIGGECVFTSEWDSYAQRTYLANFGDAHAIHGDITKVDARDIPDHDVLLAGFPCQPFSIAGVSKKNALGRKHGFEDETQGTLFFDVARIIKEKRPRAFLLENVKNLQSHDKGRTFDVIQRTLTEELGYRIHVKIIDGAHFVPQHRERIVIVGFRDTVPFNWNDLALPQKGLVTMGDILHKTDGSEPELPHDTIAGYFNHGKDQVNPKYVLTDKLWQYLRDYKEKHQAKGNGFGFGLVGPKDVSRTLSARYYKDGSEILVRRGSHNPRRLTPRECARLMGFPDSWKIPVSDTRAYKQFGNSVVTLAFQEIARIMEPHIITRKAVKGAPSRRKLAANA